MLFSNEYEQDIKPTDITSRLDFVRLIDQNNWKVGVEVGSFEGKFSEHLLENSSLDVLYSIDKWADRNGDSEVYPPMRSRMACRKRLRKYGKRSVMIQKESLSASWDFPNKHFDFIYIDAGHDSLSVLSDLGIWWKKVKTGGFFGGHDYVLMPHEGASVIFLVDTFADLVGQTLYVTGAKDKSPEERHKAAYLASADMFSDEVDEFEPPSWWMIKD